MKSLSKALVFRNWVAQIYQWMENDWGDDLHELPKDVKDNLDALYRVADDWVKTHPDFASHKKSLIDQCEKAERDRKNPFG
jgi:hypothetical protein